MKNDLGKSVQCVGLTYVGPYKIVGASLYLGLILELIDGSEISYLVSRPAAKSLIDGLAVAERLARS